MLMLLLCGSCGGSSSETPPPLEPDPKRLRAPAEAPAADQPSVAAPAAAAPTSGASPDNVEEGAEFGIEPGGTQPAAANGASKQTWGGAPSNPTSKAKRPPPRAP
jgi:hypothetical protein